MMTGWRMPPNKNGAIARQINPGVAIGTGYREAETAYQVGWPAAQWPWLLEGVEDAFEAGVAGQGQY
jgi:hypothetical protein